MDRDFLDAIWLQFETEAMEHCTSSEDLLLETEFNEYEAAKIDSLFRAFHSLKGLFGTVGLNKTLELTHLIEDVIDKIRSLEVPLNNKIRGALLKCIDVLKNIITSSSQEREEIVDENLDVVKQLIVSIRTTDFDVNDNKFLHDMGFIIECVKSVVYREMGLQHPMTDIMKQLTVSTIDETNTLSTELDIDKVVKTTQFVSELEDDGPEMA